LLLSEEARLQAEQEQREREERERQEKEERERLRQQVFPREISIFEIITSPEKCTRTALTIFLSLSFLSSNL